MAPSEQTIPVLDLDDFRAGGEREARFVQALGDAFVDTGFAALVHHGVDLDLAREATAIAAAFFDLPRPSSSATRTPSSSGSAATPPSGASTPRINPSLI